MSGTDSDFFRQWKITFIWEMNLEIDWDEFMYKNRFRHQNLCLGPQFWCWQWRFLDWLFVANLCKNTKINFTSESLKTKEHKESNSYEKCDFPIDPFYKINWLRAESARAVTGRWCPHSGEGEHFWRVNRIFLRKLL